MPIDIKQFDLGEKVSTGGVTGSARVKHKDQNHYYQLKPSILSNSFTRKLKAFWKDRENFGEVIASKIALSITPMINKFKPVPDVSLVLDKQKQEVAVASKYLSGKELMTLDDYAQKKLGVDMKGSRHVAFVNSSKGQKAGKGKYDISGENNTKLRKQLASAIATSAMVGDHDVNPGNMLVVDGNIARIDFGHAFNDLLNAPKMFGGKVHNSKNQAIDFLNRETVASFPRGGKSKLWRDYPGLVPSQEMADAFKEFSELGGGLEKGIKDAKSEFKSLLEQVEKDDITPKEKNKIKKHLASSLEAISEAINMPLPKKIKADDAIDKVFDNLNKFVSTNLKQMGEAAKLMQLQADIDNTLTTLNEGKPIGKKHYEKLAEGFKTAIKQESLVNSKTGQLQWIKTSAKNKAKSCSFREYLTSRAKELGMEASLGNAVADGIKSIKNQREKDSTIKIPKVEKAIESPSINTELRHQESKHFAQNYTQHKGISPEEIIKRRESEKSDHGR